MLACIGARPGRAGAGPYRQGGGDLGRHLALVGTEERPRLLAPPAPAPQQPRGKLQGAGAGVGRCGLPVYI